MASNEAKVKFTADVADFNSAIKTANSAIKELQSELKLNNTTMASTSSTVDTLKERLSILTSQSEALAQKKEALNAKLEQAIKYFGEDSTEAASLRTQLNNLENESQKVAQQIDKTNQEIEEQEKATKQNESALGQLTQTISEQEDKLSALKEQYVNAVLEFGETSDEAKDLAGQITNLSGELQENKEKLSTASDAADKLTDSQEEAKQKSEKWEVALGNLISNGIQKLIQSVEQAAEAVVDLGMEFTATMSEVGAISGATGDELEELEETAREYGATTVFSASESAEALKYMALAGWDVEESTSALSGVLNLAAASGMDLADASDMVTDYLSAFNMEASEAAYMADLLAYAQSNSNTTAEQLGEAYGNCAADLNAAGQDIETVTSLLEAMANQGTKGSEAGTALKNIMKDITSAMEKGSITIGKTKIAVADADGSYRDLTDILTDLEAATADMTETERASALQDVFTTKALSGLNLIFNEGMDSVSDYEEALRSADGTAEDMAETMTDNLSGDMKEMNSALEELQLKIFDGLEEPLRSATQFVTNSVVPALTTLVQNFDSIAPVLAAVAVAIGIYEVAVNSAAIAQTAAAVSAGALASPILAIVAVVGVLTAAFMTLWNTNDEFREAILEIWNAICESVSEFIGGITERLDELGISFTTTGSVIGDLQLNWQAFCDILAPVFEGAFGAVQTILETVLNALLDLWDFWAAVFQGDWEGAWEAIVNLFFDLFNGLLQFAAAILDTIGDVIGIELEAIGTNWEEVWTGITTFFQNAWDTISNIAGTALELINALMSGDLETAKGIVDNVLNSILDTFTNIFESAQNVVSNAIDKIKSAFEFEWSLPELKLPHVSISGEFSLMPLSVPTFSLDWYASGGILTQPTIFGFGGGSFLGGGEAGAEAVLPIDLLREYISTEIENALGEIRIVNEMDYDALAAAIAKQPIGVYIGKKEFGRAVREVT